MAFSSTDLLQFDELLELVARYAGSTAGRELVFGLEPHSDRFVLEADLADAGEAIGYQREIEGGLPANGRGVAVPLRIERLRDMGNSLATLQVEGSSLDGRQIMDLLHNLGIAGEFRGALLGVAERYPRLARRGNQLADLRGLVKKHEHAFLPDGSLSDDASVALRRIRRDIESQKRGIQDSLEHFMRAHRADGTIQEDFVTIREDRYVVPVVAGRQSRVDGVVHGSSGTGRTLFLEPLETIGLNNQLVRLREDQIREVQRILAEITDTLREHAVEILATAQVLAELDCIFAKAGFAREYEAVIPVFSKDTRRLAVEGARHPLLETILRKQKKPIVPISFELSEQKRCLLISGPNTGGKTVTMKTAGLLAVMAHAGLPVPAAKAEFPVLDDVLADIGDQQSIEESLSSFSGHLLHVKDMLNRVTPDSMVLLDELGRATDPEEGGALGVAILDEFRKSGAFCLASTHLLPLKLYGARTEGVLNASMGFDEATLQPTYQLKVGMPGKSAGIDIATRLQMPEVILQHARSVLPRLQADFEALLSELHKQVEEHKEAAREARAAAAGFEKRRAELESQAVRNEQKRQREWADKSDFIVADFEARAQLMLKELIADAEQRKTADQAMRAISRTKREFREEAATALPKAAPAVQSQIAAPMVEGARVKLRDVREPATIRRILKNGVLEVEAGFLKMQVSRDDVIEVLTGEAAKAKPKNINIDVGPRWDMSYRELNLLGRRAEEATDELDKFLDSAVLASVDRVRIIHGHGMGVLKKAVGEVLSRNPHVGRFYAATPSEGGTGATIVELRD